MAAVKGIFAKETIEVQFVAEQVIHLAPANLSHRLKSRPTRLAVRPVVHLVGRFKDRPLVGRSNSATIRSTPPTVWAAMVTASISGRSRIPSSTVPSSVVTWFVAQFETDFLASTALTAVVR